MKVAPAAAMAWPQQLAALPRGNRRAVLETRVLELATKVLGLDGGQVPDVRRPLQELGLDSLMAVELRNALRRLGRPLPSTLLFDHPTVGLAGRGAGSARRCDR